MSETITVAIVSASSALSGVLLTQYFNSKNENKKREYDQNLERLKTKKEKLDPIYRELIKIINSFPEKTPNDVLKLLDYAPNYSLEDFDTVNRILDIQNEDDRKRLERASDNEQRSEIETRIRNREYYKREIERIKNQYTRAKDDYESFKLNKKIDFELYAGQEVKDYLVKFDVIRDNAFKSGRKLEHDNGRKNNLKNAIWRLTSAMRRDIDID